MKKGASQVDWAISLSVFLLYLAWFFIFVRPAVEPPADTESLITLVKDGLESVTHTVEIIPLFVNSNISSSEEPIAVRFRQGWGNNTFAFSDERFFYLDEQRIYFLARIRNETNVFTIAHSGFNYSKNNVTKDLVSGNTFASVDSQNFRADFIDSILDKVIFSDIVRLSGFTLKIDGLAVENELVNKRTNDFSSITAKYKIETDVFNHSSVVFAENSRVYGFVDSNRPTESHTLRIQAALDNFTNYFADNTNQNLIDYDISTCDAFQSNYVDFYRTAQGISFITDPTSNITVCYDSDGLTVDIKLPLKNHSTYRIIAHTGDFTNTQGLVNDFTARFGLADTREGISEELLNITNATDYSDLKKRFDYPSDREFSYELLNESGAAVFLYSPVFPDEFTNVFADEFDKFLLTKFGVLKKHTFRVKTW